MEADEEEDQVAEWAEVPVPDRGAGGEDARFGLLLPVTVIDVDEVRFVAEADPDLDLVCVCIFVDFDLVFPCV